MSEWSIDLPSARPLNANDREHHIPRAHRVRQWRHDAGWCVIAARVPKGLDAVAVELHAYPPDRRRRDRHNLAPTLKAVVDGIVDAGVIADDTPDRLAAERIVLHREAGQSRWRWRVVITDRTEATEAAG